MSYSYLDASLLPAHLVCDSLTTKLPFDDDEFDHVHIRSIARGVPENKVSTSISEYISYM